ncbi:hypothetical protein F5Y08DRAFT_339757 [Xylaria arbuscula]|nr:hypothetical protein F5Y08DRAFT_339757 [Xylaria arbuscula]
MDVLGNPANISNTYTEDSTVGTDCTLILGPECVDAIISDASSISATRANTVQNWASMPECASTFGYIWNQSTANNIGNEEFITYDRDGDVTFDSSEDIWHATSSAYHASSTPVYQRTANKLQVMMMARSSQILRTLVDVHASKYDSPG